MVDQLQTVDVNNIYEDDIIMGPGFFMFFTYRVRCIPAHYATTPKAKPTKPKKKFDYLKDQMRELDLDEQDISDIITLLLLSGIIE